LRFQKLTHHHESPAKWDKRQPRGKRKIKGKRVGMSSPIVDLLGMEATIKEKIAATKS